MGYKYPVKELNYAIGGCKIEEVYSFSEPFKKKKSCVEISETSIFIKVN